MERLLWIISMGWIIIHVLIRWRQREIWNRSSQWDTETRRYATGFEDTRRGHEPRNARNAALEAGKGQGNSISYTLRRRTAQQTPWCLVKLILNSWPLEIAGNKCVLFFSTIFAVFRYSDDRKLIQKLFALKELQAKDCTSSFEKSISNTKGRRISPTDWDVMS